MLHEACIWNFVDILQILLQSEKSVDVNARDHHGNTALYLVGDRRTKTADGAGRLVGRNGRGLTKLCEERGRERVCSNFDCFFCTQVSRLQLPPSTATRMLSQPSHERSWNMGQT